MYEHRKYWLRKRCKLRTEIDESVKQSKIQMNRNLNIMESYLGAQFGRQYGSAVDYSPYFNYGLNTHTWRLLVNKQIQ